MSPSRIAPASNRQVARMGIGHARFAAQERVLKGDAALGVGQSPTDPLPEALSVDAALIQRSLAVAHRARAEFLALPSVRRRAAKLDALVHDVAFAIVGITTPTRLAMHLLALSVMVAAAEVVLVRSPFRQVFNLANTDDLGLLALSAVATTLVVIGHVAGRALASVVSTTTRRWVVAVTGIVFLAAAFIALGEVRVATSRPGPPTLSLWATFVLGALPAIFSLIVALAVEEVPDSYKLRVLERRAARWLAAQRLAVCRLYEVIDEQVALVNAIINTARASDLAEYGPLQHLEVLTLTEIDLLTTREDFDAAVDRACARLRDRQDDLGHATPTGVVDLPTPDPGAPGTNGRSSHTPAATP